jgi:hypothetical protein
VSDNGGCGLYPYWNGVCSTWFCKYTTGQEGREFWLALRAYLEHAEAVLSRYALLQMGFEPGIILRSFRKSTSITPSEMDNVPDNPAVRREVWGKWTGREEALYKEAFRIVRGLSPGEYSNLAGLRERLLRGNLEMSHRRLTCPALPEVLLRNPELRVIRIVRDGYLAVGYSPLDPITISSRLYQALHVFDGVRNVEEAASECLKRGWAFPDLDTLHMLYGFRVLVEGPLGDDASY